ncbi:hypothetical protein HI914_04233 [Erysiphe necator]|uniref:Uncharacterized protein n=1 Tax=Uncinula necator TaxID=52586 RepID=A0A0B1P6T9_UNCNE|nr:hypothetical protein HI914_04233 [Erysiphe necator]KHJ33065.1 hypothetical protein EV44_g2238 [Erysiphe necator]
MRPTFLRRAAQAARDFDKNLLKKSAKKDPELWVLFGVMSGAFGLAGYYFARKPTSPVSEVKVAVAQMPWEANDDEIKADYKYRYHPGANPKLSPQEAPSALNVVIVPDVTLPKELHEKFNKWGKDGY